MRRAWRLVKEEHAADAFSGEGAANFGGRWNSRGVAVVYASGSLSLAALETLVHLVRPVPFRYAAFRIEFPESLVEAVRMNRLPPEWTAEPPAACTKTLGDNWAREERTAVLQVPSVLVPGEANYLLNPAHPDFKKLRISKPQPFAFDPRLLQSPPP